MAIIKRGKWYWMDAVINGHRYRESLKTTDRRLAPGLERDRIAQLNNRVPNPTKESKKFLSMTIAEAVEAYSYERSTQVSPRMVAYWREQSRAMAASKALGRVILSKITISDISAFHRERLDAGRAPKTINGEVSVLRQLLKHGRLWYKFQDDYRPIPNNKPSVGRAVTQDQIEKLFDIARSRPDWKFAYTAATLSFFCGMRACEIRALQWKHVDFVNRLLDIRRSKTPAGWRIPSLNETCLLALREMYELASNIGANDSEHYIFPWHGREQKIDPTRPMTSWRSAWRSIRAKAGLANLRFHDGRHTAITTMAEKGLPDWVIQAQVGHVDPQMMKTYSHIRRKALDGAAAALEPATIKKKNLSSELLQNADLIG